MQTSFGALLFLDTSDNLSVDPPDGITKMFRVEISYGCHMPNYEKEEAYAMNGRGHCEDALGTLSGISTCNRHGKGDTTHTCIH